MPAVSILRSDPGCAITAAVVHHNNFIQVLGVVKHFKRSKCLSKSLFFVEGRNNYAHSPGLLGEVEFPAFRKPVPVLDDMQQKADCEKCREEPYSNHEEGVDQIHSNHSINTSHILKSC